jgi:saccharopine dehydrogenase-like NADP-dependent oxidoreductase
MGKKVLLVGLGVQGKAALCDLVNCSDISQIIVVDRQPDLQTYLSRHPSGKVSGQIMDVTDEAWLSALMREVDVVVEALPGSFALPLGRLAAECGVSIVSSMYYLDPGEQDPEKIQSMKNHS